MKYIAVPVLMVLMLAQTFSKGLVVMEYNLNRNYIAKNLCINRQRPKLHCNGKCQMMKRLAEEEKQNSSNTSNTIKIQTLDLVFSNRIYKIELPTLVPTRISYNEDPPLLEYSAPIASIFHPPALG
jgi:hypothetical protein